jgi:phosphatidylglycerophosphate synthase
MANIRTHLRVNESLLSPLERPALRWLAARMPAWMTPDILTGIGVVGALVIFASYCLTALHPAFLWLASLGFLINWFGDSLDGTLARYRHIERPRYGFFIDHSIDAVNEVLVFIGLGLSPYARFDIILLALVGYLLVSIHVFVRTAVNGTFKISYIGLGPTEVRLIAITTNALTFFLGNKLFDFPFRGEVVSISIYDVVSLGIAILLFAIYLVATIQEAQELSLLGE